MAEETSKKLPGELLNIYTELLQVFIKQRIYSLFLQKRLENIKTKKSPLVNETLGLLKALQVKEDLMLGVILKNEEIDNSISTIINEMNKNESAIGTDEIRTKFKDQLPIIKGLLSPESGPSDTPAVLAQLIGLLSPKSGQSDTPEKLAQLIGLLSPESGQPDTQEVQAQSNEMLSPQVDSVSYKQIWLSLYANIVSLQNDRRLSASLDRDALAGYLKFLVGVHDLANSSAKTIKKNELKLSEQFIQLIADLKSFSSDVMSQQNLRTELELDSKVDIDKIKPMLEQQKIVNPKRVLWACQNIIINSKIQTYAVGSVGELKPRDIILVQNAYLQLMQHLNKDKHGKISFDSDELTPQDKEKILKSISKPLKAKNFFGKSNSMHAKEDLGNFIDLIFKANHISKQQGQNAPEVVREFLQSKAERRKQINYSTAAAITNLCLHDAIALTGEMRDVLLDPKLQPKGSKYVSLTKELYTRAKKIEITDALETGLSDTEQALLQSMRKSPKDLNLLKQITDYLADNASNSSRIHFLLTKQIAQYLAHNKLSIAAHLRDVLLDPIGGTKQKVEDLYYFILANIKASEFEPESKQEPVEQEPVEQEPVEQKPVAPETKPEPEPAPKQHPEPKPATSNPPTTTHPTKAKFSIVLGGMRVQNDSWGQIKNSLAECAMANDSATRATGVTSRYMRQNTFKVGQGNDYLKITYNPARGFPLDDIYIKYQDNNLRIDVPAAFLQHTDPAISNMMQSLFSQLHSVSKVSKQQTSVTLGGLKNIADKSIFETLVAKFAGHEIKYSNDGTHQIMNSDNKMDHKPGHH